jgi:hypothetical protein
MLEHIGVDCEPPLRDESACAVVSLPSEQRFWRVAPPSSGGVTCKSRVLTRIEGCIKARYLAACG